MDLKEMRELPNEELHSEIEKAREKVFKMRFQGKGKDIENLGEYKALRKAIARLHTVLRERGKSALERRSTAPGLSHGTAPGLSHGTAPVTAHETARGSSHGTARGAGGEP